MLMQLQDFIKLTVVKLDDCGITGEVAMEISVIADHENIWVADSQGGNKLSFTINIAGS